jgi:hypothetical protein
MEHPPEDSSSCSSLPRLFNQLEAILAEEYQNRNIPWIHIARLKEMVYQRYGMVLDHIIQNQDSDHSLKSLLKSSQRFAIYSTPIAQSFYVARLQDTVPNYSQNNGKPIQYRIKRPWKVDRRLITMLEHEGAKRMSSSPSPSRSAYPLTLPSRLLSMDDLELALTKILTRLTIDHPENMTTVSALSKAFYNHYRQPIRTAVRSLCPGMMLIDVLEIMSGFDVWEEDDGEVMIHFPRMPFRPVD